MLIYMDEASELRPILASGFMFYDLHFDIDRVRNCLGCGLHGLALHLKHKKKILQMLRHEPSASVCQHFVAIQTH